MFPLICCLIRTFLNTLIKCKYLKNVRFPPPCTLMGKYIIITIIKYMSYKCFLAVLFLCVTHFREAGLTAWTDLPRTNELLVCSLPANRTAARLADSQWAAAAPRRSECAILFVFVSPVTGSEIDQGEGGEIPGDVSPPRLIGRAQTDRGAGQSEGRREAGRKVWERHKNETITNETTFILYWNYNLKR